MKTLNLTLAKSKLPVYLKIANALRTAINAGHVAPSESLPSARSLATQLSVNRHTIMAAYQELVAQGWVETQERRAYTVVQTLPIAHALAKHAGKVTDTPQHQWRVTKSLHGELNQSAAQYQFNFAGGSPDVELFPFNEFKSYLHNALTKPPIDELNYGNNQGFKPLIEQVSTYLRRVRSITNKEIIVVNGTQEALYILGQILLTTGDKVAVESLGYRPAWSALQNAGAQLIGIKQTAQGIDVEHLEQMFKQHQIRLLYLTPLHQYPTTTTLSAAKRLQIYRLAQAYNIAIIEDDYDHEFHYDSQPLAPMAANDPSGLVIYLSSFSKIMFPGIRLGVIAVDKTLLPHIVNYRAIVNHKVNVVIQDAIARWMKHDGFERHLRKATRIYQRRRDCIIEQLNSFKAQGIDLEFSVPAGGMALWLNVGHNAERIVELAKAKGVFLVAESAFHLDSSNNQDRFIRIGFAGQNETNIKQGLLTLKPLFNKRHRA
ncbi:MAG: PLP-dependent aminotransferase family protein [Gammaproteobacteria bacterium]|nr:PLP-dependent aminotransferase family protein [Gammaproteobacteria bacterium]